MKVRKYIKRDRTTANRATGTLLCCLSIPVIGEEFNLRTASVNPLNAIGSIRKFVDRHLPRSPDLLAGANFIIQAEIRASGGGFRRKLITSWMYGEDIVSVLNETSKQWALFDFEDDDWTTVEVEINFD
jgi:hypothetical protein